ncbi:hypothetical protein E4U57_007451 [Claviceps arundinis]|uniref:Carboxylesterase type B domain-containing protein n=1 Tax=Claviceps arundinis TaxID=1623583 RepID=A0ABQ7PGX3_9HYPO|nr:hypothetical protein E4U57_007451 [Claviceps arundinis]
MYSSGLFNPAAIITSLGYAISLFSLPGLASPSDGLYRKHQQAPTVSVKNGTYEGIYSPGYHQDFFLGVPYAKKPQRFSSPQPLDEGWDTIRPATSYSPHCLGYGSESIGYNMSEDCLYLNIIRPHGLARDAKLPVVFNIHGGGLHQGGSADKRFNLSFIVEQSVQMKKPIIGVSLNYRLAAWGFLGSKEAIDAGATNIGYRDQRMALHWVNENIHAVGGSPDKVTIWGESSGAESVTVQVLANNGQHGRLFRGAIGQSGFGGMLPRLPGGFNATAAHQITFDNFVRSIPSCASSVNTPNALKCLRESDFKQLNASITHMTEQSTSNWVPVLDGNFLNNHSAKQMANGQFAKVPILVGSNSDEGAMFGGVANTDDDFRGIVQQAFSPNASDNINKSIHEIVNEVAYLYPNIQSIGIPSLQTMPHVLQAGDEYTQQVGLQRRRVNAFIGDMLFGYLRRRANLAWSRHGIPSFAYRFDVRPHGLPDTLGATHFQEVAFVFHNLDGVGYDINPFGGNDTQYTESARALATTMCAQWINFIVHQDPNGPRGSENAPANTSWPVFNPQDGGGSGRGMVLRLDGPSVEWDDVRATAFNWFIENDLGLFGN